MSLINKVRKASQKGKIERQIEGRDRLREMTGDTKTIDTGFFSDMTENEILDYLRYEILRIAPIYGTILSGRLKVVKREITIYANGKDIFIGKEFFKLKPDRMKHLLLGQIGRIVTGTYIKAHHITSDKDYISFIRLVYLEIADRVITDTMTRRPDILGYKRSITEIINKEYINENMTTKSIGIEGYPIISIFNASKIQKHLENDLRKEYEDFLNLNGDKNKVLELTVNMQKTISGKFKIDLKGDSLLKSRRISSMMEEERKINKEIMRLEELRNSLLNKKKNIQNMEDENTHDKDDFSVEKEIEKLKEEIYKEKKHAEKNIEAETEKNIEVETEENIEVETKEHEVEKDYSSDPETKIEAWDVDNNQYEQKSDDYYQSKISEIGSPTLLEIITEMTTKFDSLIYAQWYNKCIEEGAYEPEYQLTSLRKTLIENNYTKDDIIELVNSLECIKDSKKIIESIIDKLDPDREETIYDTNKEEAEKELEKVKQADETGNSLDCSNLYSELEEDTELPEEEFNIDRQEYSDQSQSQLPAEQTEDISQDIREDGDYTQDEFTIGEDDIDLDFDSEFGDHQIYEYDEYSEEELDRINDEYSKEGNDLTRDSDTESTGTYSEIDIEDEIQETEYQLEHLKEQMEKLKEKIDSQEISDEDSNLISVYESEQTIEDIKDLFTELETMYTSDEYKGTIDKMELTKELSKEYLTVNKNWIKQLENLIEYYIPNKSSSFRRANKKYVHSGILLPSKVTPNRKNSIENVNIYCDISGSMSQRDIQVLKGVLRSSETRFPKKTKAYGFNNYLRELRYNNGRLREEIKGSGGTSITAVLKNLDKRLSGRCINIIISDGGFNWGTLKEHMEKEKREIIVVILTSNFNTYENRIKVNKSRFVIINAEEFREENDSIIAFN